MKIKIQYLPKSYSILNWYIRAKSNKSKFWNALHLFWKLSTTMEETDLMSFCKESFRYVDAVTNLLIYATIICRKAHMNEANKGTMHTVLLGLQTFTLSLSNQHGSSPSPFHKQS